MLVTSILVYTSLLNPYYVLFWPKAIFAIPPQLWRLVTCFTLSGPQFGMLMDPYFLYTHGSRLETGSPRFTQPGDFFTYIVFVCATIMVSTHNIVFPKAFSYAVRTFAYFDLSLPPFMSARAVYIAVFGS